MEEKTLQLFLEHFNLMRTELVGFRAEFRDFTAYIEKRFEAVEKRLDKIEERLMIVETKLDAVMETRIVTYDDLKEYSKINKLKFTL